MDKKKKKKILKELKELVKKVKQMPSTGIEFTVKSGETSSLGKVIKTREQADFFMKMLRSLDPKNASS
jgi:hypothetical protein